MKWGILSLVFIVGIMIGSMLTHSAFSEVSGAEIPLASAAEEKNSPYDRINESQIHVYKDNILIEVNDPEWATFTDTNSMDPLLDTGANALQVVPNSESEIHVGDIISYQSEYADGIIIHRVIEIHQDEQGTFFVVKGDNNPEPDPGKIRFSQIKKVLIGVIY